MQYLKATKHKNLEFALSKNKQKKLVVKGKVLYLDGWDPETGTAFQFHGCIFHGCPKCTTHSKIGAYGMSYWEVYSNTVWRDSLIQSHPEVKELRIKWECEYDAECNPKHAQADAQLIEFLKTTQKQKLKHAAFREAYKGGLVCCFGLYANSQKVKERLQELGRDVDGFEANIIQADVHSMYPAMLLDQNCGYAPPELGPLRIPTGPSTSIFAPDTMQECSPECCHKQEAHQPCGPVECGFICEHHLPKEQWGTTPGYARCTSHHLEV